MVTVVVILGVLAAGALGMVALRLNRYVALSGAGNALVLGGLISTPALVGAFVFAGLRPTTAGFDTPTYVAAFTRLDGMGSANEVGRQFFGNAELLWWPFQSLLRPFLDAEGWLAANVVLIILAVAYLYRIAAAPHKLNVWLFALVFLTYFFVYAGNAMRQALALPLGAAGFLLICERRHYGWLLVAAAVGFHWSALVFVSAPLFQLRLFARRWPFLVIPVVAALCSIFLGRLADFLAARVGGEAFDAKYDLYFDPNHVSHVGPVWGTFNFWLCVGTSVTFLAFCPPARSGSRALHSLVMLGLVLVVFGVRVADISERFMPLVLLVLPLMAVLLVGRLRFSPLVKNAIVVSSFVAMFGLVLFSESAQLTLGYTA